MKASITVVAAFAIAGRVVRQALVTNINSPAALDLRGLRAGVCIVKLTSQSFTIGHKLVLQR